LIMGTNRRMKAEVKEDDRKALGDRLREARDYLGFSQEEVANYLGVPRTALTSIEAGTRKVDALELKKLATLYKRPVAHFTGEDVGEEFGDEDVAHLARKARELSPEDRAELGRFADFLRAKTQAKGD
jgi:transcriptional regulator with XRE-family HTH domain